VLLGNSQTDSSDVAVESGSEIIQGLGIDEFLLNYGGSHSFEEIMYAVEIFFRSNLPELRDYFESSLIRSANYMDMQRASNALYLMVSREFGSNKAIQAMIDRVLDDSLKTDLMDA